jgi:hypothetical protein
MAPMLTRRTALLAQMESTYDVAPSFNGATDALLIDAPTFTADMQILQRKVVMPSLSRLRHQVGRKLSKIKFTAEPNLNDLANTGLAGNAPVLGRLFRGCGMHQTANAATWITGVLPQTGEAGEFATWSSSVTGSYASHPIAYIMTVTTPGGSGTAMISIAPQDPSLDTAQTNVALVNGTPISVGSNGAVVTPSSLGTLTAGMSWVVVLMPPCLTYTPVSTGYESISLEMFVDGSLHLITGAYGTFSAKMDAGQIITFDFDFTGIYNAYVDQAFPTVTYPVSRPPVFQKAGISTGTFNPIAQSVTFDLGVTVSERMSATATDGLYGLMITDRMAKAGVDPEATAAATQDFWDTMASAPVVPVFARGGTVAGSRMFFMIPASQYDGISYKDRNGIRAHDISLSCNQINGDDEVLVALY